MASRQFRLFVPAQAVSANLVYFDLFNGSGTATTVGQYNVQVNAVIPIMDGTVAVTGLVGVNLFLTKTTAIGTGGTGATLRGSSLTAATFTPHDHDWDLPTTITARLTPAGGAVAGGVLSQRCLFTEESASGAYTTPMDMVRCGYTDVPGVMVLPGTGIRVVQGSVASVGSFAFDVIFSLIDR